MSNPTNPFNWQMPTATDLVTDLPADFEVFGQAVATSMADLLGGTTGQILSKNSNTDMDFVWITNDQGDITAVNVTSPITGGGTSGAVTVGIQSASTSQSGAVQLSDSTSTTSSVLAATPTAVKSAYDLAAAAIPKSTVTAKGSIVAASASSTPAQLAVGNNGETLVADSSTSTGLRYQSAYNGNAVINGGFDIWQRGTSIANTATYLYTADRWQGGAAAAQTTTRQASGLTGIQYCARVQRNSGSTSTTVVALGVSMESADSYRFAGQTATFSFWARAGANYSNTGNLLGVYVQSGTGTDQNQNSGFTGATGVINTNATLTTSWQRFTYTGTFAANATQIGLTCYYTPTGTAGANDYFEVTGVQLELGSVATSFKRASGGTIQGELAACQRYYFRFNADTNGILLNAAFAGSGGAANGQAQFPVPMRVAPTSLDIATVKFQNYGGSGYNLTSPAFNQQTTTGAQVYGNASGTTAGHVGIFNGQTTGSYIGFSAEL